MLPISYCATLQWPWRTKAWPNKTIKSYLSAVHWLGSRIQRSKHSDPGTVPRSCGTSKGTRPLCVFLGALYDWVVPSLHTPKHGATMLTTIPGARLMIDNSRRKSTTINHTMSRLHVVMMMTSSFTCVKQMCCYGYLNDLFLFLMCSLAGWFDEEEWDTTLLGDLLIKAPHLEYLK